MKNLEIYRCNSSVTCKDGSSYKVGKFYLFDNDGSTNASFESIFTKINLVECIEDVKCGSMNFFKGYTYRMYESYGRVCVSYFDGRDAHINNVNKYFKSLSFNEIPENVKEYFLGKNR